jgi:hypothetical protein
VDKTHANALFQEVRQHFEGHLRIELNEARDEGDMQHAFDHLSQLELVHSFQERAIHRVALASGYALSPVASFESAKNIAHQLQRICERRSEKVGILLRPEEVVDFYTDALLGLLWAYVEPTQDEFDAWVKGKRKCPFFNLDLEPIEMS